MSRPEGDVAVVDCLGTGDPALTRVAEAPAAGPAHVLALRLRPGADDPLATWVVEGSVLLLAALRAVVRREAGDAPPVVLLVWPAAGLDPAEGQAAEAAWEAARGIAQAATLEVPTALARVSAVRAEDGGEDDLARALAYLFGPEGGFVAGTSLDLRGRAAA